MYRYVIGDIHGHADLLQALLSQIIPHFNNNDKLIFVGDYIDRGPNSKQVIDIILSLKKTYPKQIICLKGNHEQWFLDTYHNHSKISWLISMEGFSTIESYSQEAATILKEAITQLGKELLFPSDPQNPSTLPYQHFLSHVPPTHIEFFQSLQLFYEDQDIICTHSGLDVEGPELRYQTEEDLLWAPSEQMLQMWQGPKTLIVGHKATHKVDPTSIGFPLITKHTILIDTSPSQTSTLSAIRFPDRKVFQGKGQQSATS